MVHILRGGSSNEKLHERGYLPQTLFGTNISWTTNPKIAWICVAIVGIWSSVGYNMVLLLGGLQDIPKDYYEAAAIDGATGIDAFFHLTIPLLSPTLFFIIQTGIIGALQLFDLPYMIIDQSSRAVDSVRSVTYLFYQHSFMKGERGYGSAIVIFMMVVIAIVTWMVLTAFKTKSQAISGFLTCVKPWALETLVHGAIRYSLFEPFSRL